MGNGPIQGQSDDPTVPGVSGTNTSVLRIKGGTPTSFFDPQADLTSLGVGVLGESTEDGIGVRGESDRGTGVYGESESGYGVQGQSTVSWGVWGESKFDPVLRPDQRELDPGQTGGVFGHSTFSVGVSGHSTHSWGVWGHSEEQAGVSGESKAGPGVLGQSFGESMSGPVPIQSNTGVFGLSFGEDGAGVQGQSDNGTGVFGQSGNGTTISSQSKSDTGVFGQSDDGKGVWGESGIGTGVYGKSESGFAGVFDGTVQVNGPLTVNDLTVKNQLAVVNGPLRLGGHLAKPGGGFQIDHPLDAAHKYLFHSFVESADMKNFYDGVVTLDANGQAEVPLPDWFETLNAEVRYQLTCLGSYAPVYIAQKLQNNRFTIAGGQAGMEVCWQVTGIRQDRWALAHRIPVEQDKPANEQGYYLHPDLHGEPEEKSIFHVRHPDLKRPVLPQK